MPLIIATFNHTMRIPPNFKGLTGKDWFVKEFIAEEPTEVPEKIAEYYTKSWSSKYRYAGRVEEPFYPSTGKENEPPKEFDAVDFLEENYNNIEESIRSLTDRKKLFSISEVLKFNPGYKQQPTERLQERIINDINVKKAHEEKLAKNEEAKEVT